MALLKFKRSATPSKVPTTSDLALGELALNTYDGKVYMKKDDGTQAIVEVGGTSGGGTVTSVDVSGGTTGLTFSGGPVTSSGTITQGGTLNVANGGTGATTAAGALANLGAQAAATALTTSTTFGGDVSGTYNAIVVADNSHSHTIANISNLPATFNNMGEVHGTRTSFDAQGGSLSSDFGWRYVQGSTNGPNLNSATQYYSAIIGLGSYASNNYAMQLAFPRNVSDPYIGIRYEEAGSLGAWQKISAGKADQLTTARTISLTGDVSGSTSFNGSANVSITATVADDSHNHIISNVDGLQTALDGKLSTTGKAADSNLFDNLDSVRFVYGSNQYATSDGRTDINNLSKTGHYWSSSATNKPSTGNGTTFHINHDGGTSYATQMFINHDGNDGAYFRAKDAGTWNSWQRIFSDDYHPNADTLTGFNNPTTAPTANTIAYRNSNGDIAAREIILSSGLSSATPTVLVSMYPSTNQLVRTTPAAVATSIQSAATGRWNIDVTATNDVRAPIFYDSDNTGYYVDPNSTSNLWTLNAFNTGTSINISGHIQTNAGGVKWNENGVRSWSMYPSGGGLLIASGDQAGSFNILESGGTRSRIFYDYDNTSYYVDPNSVTNIWQLKAKGRYNSDTGGSAIYIGDGVSTSDGLWINFHSDADTAYRIGKPAGAWTQPLELRFYTGIYHRAHQSYGGHRFYNYSGNSLRFSVADGDGDVRSLGNFRAPLMYDINNTNFYVNPDGTSNCNDIKAENLPYAKAGSAYGTENTFTADGGVGANNISRSMFYRDNNGQFGALGVNITHATSANYALQIACTSYSNNTGTFKFRLKNNGTWTGITTLIDDGTANQIKSGYLQSNSNLRAPIFYDSQNTGYYVDPTGLSVLFKFDNINQRVAYDRAWGNYPSITVYNTTDQGPQGDFRIHGIGGANGGDFSVRLLVDGTIESLSNVRAPIFYDSNNTGRYADLASTGDSIRASGDIVAYYSDDRLKDRGDNIANALDKVQSLNGFHYTANETAQKFGYKANPQVGVSAQEVEAILPEVVKDAAIGHGYKTVDYAKLVPLLIEAIKELKAEVETLKKG